MLTRAGVGVQAETCVLRKASKKKTDKMKAHKKKADEKKADKKKADEKKADKRKANKKKEGRQEEEVARPSERGRGPPAGWCARPPRAARCHRRGRARWVGPRVGFPGR